MLIFVAAIVASGFNQEQIDYAYGGILGRNVNLMDTIVYKLDVYSVRFPHSLRDFAGDMPALTFSNFYKRTLSFA